MIYYLLIIDHCSLIIFALFCDITRVTFKAGNGGNGSISYRREKFIEKGGPDGGNGGNGGNIILHANEHINSLIDLHSHKFFKADHGESGAGWKKYGAAAKDLVLDVPVGTLVRNPKTGEILADLKHINDAFIVAEGGRGGYGNEHFKTSTRQCPHFAELGEPGEEKEVELELQLVADVGIIGLPNAGKSTLIAAITACRPKIADYPFTTLIPNLGVAKVRESSLIIADIPGLIEGASEGKGLGDEFLRHISRNAVLVHLIDINDDPVKAYKIVQNELKQYSDELAAKKQIIVLNKIDGEDKDLEEMAIKDFRKSAKIPKSTVVLCASALLRIGLAEVLDAMMTLVKEEKPVSFAEESAQNAEMKLYQPLDEESVRYFEIAEVSREEALGDNFVPDAGEEEDDENVDEEEKKASRRYFQVKGKRINQIAIMTDFMNEEGVDRLWDVMKKLGIWSEIAKKHATGRDRVCFERFQKCITYREKL